MIFWSDFYIFYILKGEKFHFILIFILTSQVEHNFLITKKKVVKNIGWWDCYSCKSFFKLKNVLPPQSLHFPFFFFKVVSITTTWTYEIITKNNVVSQDTFRFVSNLFWNTISLSTMNNFRYNNIFEEYWYHSIYEFRFISPKFHLSWPFLLL